MRIITMGWFVIRLKGLVKLIHFRSLNINKDLLEDRKIHKSILSMHCHEVLNEFHSELEIKMTNCLLLCKHAIFLRTGSLDDVKSKYLLNFMK